MSVLWLVVPSAVVLSYVVFGLTGFGAAILLIPMLSFVLPVKVVIPLVATLGFLAAVTLSFRERRLAATHELWRIVPGMAVGIALGVYLLAHLPSHWLLPALGAVVLGFGINGFTRPAPRQRLSRAFALPTGVVAGLVGGLFGTEGPIYVLYLSRRLEGKSEFRATIATLFILSSGGRVAAYAASGLMFHGRLLLLGIALYPCVLAGLFLGNRLHHTFSAEQVRRGVYLLLIVSGISILLKTFAL